MERAWDQDDISKLLDQFLNGMSSDLLLEIIIGIYCLSYSKLGI